MDVGLFAQYVMNGLMLGMMYALVAVGFTLFFGVLDVIKFSHGDVVTVGAFTALAAFSGRHARGRNAGNGGTRHADCALSRDAAAFGAGAQHPVDYLDARHSVARIRASLLS